jgi:replicative DNA helicase
MSPAATLPPQNQEAEASTIGAVLISDQALPVITKEVRLRPDDFYRERHRLIWRAVLDLAAAGDAIDVLTVTARLDHAGVLEEVGGPAYVHSLPNVVPAVGNAASYAKIVAEDAAWRDRLHAGRLIADAAQNADQAKLAEGEALLAKSTEDRSRSRTAMPEDLAEQLWQMLEHGVPAICKWPFGRLTKLTMGGIRRGHVYVVAGWTSHGKSVFVDQVLEVAARSGLKAHLYFNEGTQEERVARLAARLAKVSFENILTGQLELGEADRISNMIERFPFGMTDCSGWTADEVARDVIHRGYDVVAVDLAPKLAGLRDQADYEAMSTTFQRLVKPAFGNCVAFLVAHLNRQRAGTTVELPPPTLQDIRSSGMFANDADGVVFVHRYQDVETGEPLAKGVIRLAKGRNARPGGVAVEFTKHLEFVTRGPESPQEVH